MLVVDLHNDWLRAACVLVPSILASWILALNVWTVWRKLSRRAKPDSSSHETALYRASLPTSPRPCPSLESASGAAATTATTGRKTRTCEFLSCFCAGRSPDDDVLPSEIKRSSIQCFRQLVTPFRGRAPDEQVNALDELLDAMRADDEIATLPGELLALRFLRAQRLDVHRALTMYKKRCRWRAANCVDEALAEIEALSPDMASRLAAAYPVSLVGRDFEGRPVKVFRIGQLDIRRSGFTLDEILRHHIRTMEAFAKTLEWRDFSVPPPDACATLASPLDGALVIIDIDGMNFTRFLDHLAYFKNISEIDQEYYPELLGRMLIINPGFGFGTAFNIMRPFIDEYTIEKIEVVQGDPRARLRRLIPQESLPEMYQLDGLK